MMLLMLVFWGFVITGIVFGLRWMQRHALLATVTLVVVVLPAIGADAPEVVHARMVANQVLGETKSVLDSALQGGPPARPSGSAPPRPRTSRAGTSERAGGCAV